MLAAVKSELIRLNRPSFLYGGIGIVCGFAALISVFVFTTADDAAGGQVGPAFAAASELASSGGFVATLTTIASLVGIVTLAFWAIAVASDYDTGLVRILTQAEPNRLRLLAGKLGALTVYTVISTLLATVVTTLVAYPLAAATGVSTAAWGHGFVLEFLSGWANLTVAALVWGAVGLAIAMATRSAGVAIAAGIGYLMVVENLIGIVAEEATNYLPAGVLSAVAAGGTATVGYLTALTLAIVYGVAAIGTSAAIFRRREIVS